MKISTRGRYALRMMLDIAINGDSGPVSFKDISLRQNISMKYMEQIGSLLTRAKMLKSVRGSQGGYNLVKPASEYTVGDILRATEGDFCIVPCMDGDYSCDRTTDCMTHRLWADLNKAITDVVDNVTLLDLINQEKNNGMVKID
jgi:Rrf2 family cysteine metabolism transcriptional repressor